MADLRFFCCFVAALCGACDDWSDDTRVRPAEAVLSEAKLNALALRDPGIQMASAVSPEGCQSARSGLQQMADTTGGAMRYEGGAELIVERSLWSQVPVRLRGDLATAIAVAESCGSETEPSDVVVTIREPDGGAVLKRGKPAAFVD